ncbi:MAG TPA: hypothetical protein K8V84_04555 [Nocardiopsis listeri]|uniref:hypothetical protein n=1 Tax=Nocardiopsis listeri TaxID=53440 RepID=UPI001DA2B1F2|nr:hypothetical protein [Nocardiopsis listeri]HJE57773.1 hypothetical protein [Nocardiopsis listeri]
MIDFILQPTQEGELRRRVLFWVPAPLPLLGLVYLLVGGTFSAPGWTILLAASVGVASLLLATVVQPTPLPEGLAPPVSARRSLHRFRQFTQLRLALALAPMVIGACAAIIGGGMYPLFAALLLAWPQLLLAMPTFFTITRARRAMEAWGTTAYLWHALSRPAKVTWPIATPLARSFRAWRTERARRLAQQKIQDQEQDKAWKDAVETERANPTEPTRPVVEDDGDKAQDGTLQRTRKLRALPEDDADNEPTALIPHLEQARDESVKDEPTEERAKKGEAEKGASAESAENEVTPSPTGPGATVGRAARQILDQGGALGLGVRNRRRGHAGRRPPSHKP